MGYSSPLLTPCHIWTIKEKEEEEEEGGGGGGGGGGEGGGKAQDTNSLLKRSVLITFQNFIPQIIR